MEADQEVVEVQQVGHSEFLKLFDEMSFAEKWKRVLKGLQEPKDSGDYKFAKLQLIRLSAPAAAIIVPTVTLLVVAILSAITGPEWTAVQTKIVQPEKAPELEKPEPLKEEPLVTPEIQQDFTPDKTISDSPTLAPPVDFSPQPAQFDTVALVKSPVIMRGIYGSRNPGSRGSLLAKYGGGGATEGAVLRALRWLKKNQNSDGSWEKHKVAMTGFALLTYLAHGETPASIEFGQTVEKAIRFLLDNRKGGGWPRRYEHPIATYAMCEAYGLTRVPMVKEAAEEGLRILIAGQNPRGGWRYSITPADESDSTVMSWCVQAIKAGKMAGLEVDGLDECMKRAVDGYKGNYADGGSGGGFGYTGPGVSGLTGAGALCLMLLGHAGDPEVKKSMITLEQATFNWQGGGQFNKNYYWYYITQAKFQTGGEVWNRWNALFAPTLVKNQTIIANAIEGPDGKMTDIGFWDMPQEITGHTDGVVMNTCLCTLQLEVYYRYLPTFKQAEAGEAAGEVVEQPKDDVDIKVEPANG